MSKLTVGWTRAESTASLPDSGIVFPPAKLTVGWKPMLGTAVLDWDPADLLVTPGAGPDPDPTPDPPAPDPTGTTPTTTTGAPAPAPVATAGAPGPAAPPAPSGPAPFGAPDVRVTLRRTSRLFRRDGLTFDVIPPADVTVRSVLTARLSGKQGGRTTPVARRLLTRADTTIVRKGARTRIRLRISNAGKAAIKDRARVEATLELRLTYRGGQELAVSRKVVLQK